MHHSLLLLYVCHLFTFLKIIIYTRQCFTTSLLVSRVNFSQIPTLSSADNKVNYIAIDPLSVSLKQQNFLLSSNLLTSEEQLSPRLASWKRTGSSLQTGGSVPLQFAYKGTLVCQINVSLEPSRHCWYTKTYWYSYYIPQSSSIQLTLLNRFRY